MIAIVNMNKRAIVVIIIIKGKDVEMPRDKSLRLGSERKGRGGETFCWFPSRGRW